MQPSRGTPMTGSEPDANLDLIVQGKKLMTS